MDKNGILGSNKGRQNQIGANNNLLIIDSRGQVNILSNVWTD